MRTGARHGRTLIIAALLAPFQPVGSKTQLKAGTLMARAALETPGVPGKSGNMTPIKTLARPAIVGVAYIALKTGDMAAARRFYAGILGFQEPFRLDKEPSGRQPSYFKVNDHQYIEVFPELKDPKSDRLSHVAFEKAMRSNSAPTLPAAGSAFPIKPN